MGGLVQATGGQLRVTSMTAGKLSIRTPPPPPSKSNTFTQDESIGDAVITASGRSPHRIARMSRMTAHTVTFSHLKSTLDS